MKTTQKTDKKAPKMDKNIKAKHITQCEIKFHNAKSTIVCKIHLKQHKLHIKKAENSITNISLHTTKSTTRWVKKFVTQPNNKCQL